MSIVERLAAHHLQRPYCSCGGVWPCPMAVAPASGLREAHDRLLAILLRMGWRSAYDRVRVALIDSPDSDGDKSGLRDLLAEAAKHLTDPQSGLPPEQRLVNRIAAALAAPPAPASLHPRTYSLTASGPHGELFLVTDDESGINIGHATKIGGPLTAPRQVPPAPAALGVERLSLALRTLLPPYSNDRPLINWKAHRYETWSGPRHDLTPDEFAALIAYADEHAPGQASSHGRPHYYECIVPGCTLDGHKREPHGPWSHGPNVSEADHCPACQK